MSLSRRLGMMFFGRRKTPPVTSEIERVCETSVANIRARILDLELRETERARREQERNEARATRHKRHAASTSSAAVSEMKKSEEAVTPPPPPPPLPLDTSGLEELVSQLGEPGSVVIDDSRSCSTTTTATHQTCGSSSARSSSPPLAEDLNDLSELLSAAAAIDSAAPTQMSVVALLRGFGEAEDANPAGLRRARKKRAMEDRHCCCFPFRGDESRAFFGVFDGFAGSEAAEFARDLIQDELARRLGEGEGLEDVLPRAMEEVERVMVERKEFDCVGTTCTGVLLWRDQATGGSFLRAANVGDSNAFLFRGGVAVPLTVEHKATSPAERERIRDAGIELAPTANRLNGIAVARALGVGFVKKEVNVGIVGTPSVSQCHALTDLDTLVVMASDGLWDVISGQAACELIQYEPDAQTMATKLIRYAVTNHKCVDNVTVLVMAL